MKGIKVWPALIFSAFDLSMGLPKAFCKRQNSSESDDSY